VTPRLSDKDCRANDPIAGGNEAALAALHGVHDSPKDERAHRVILRRVLLLALVALSASCALAPSVADAPPELVQAVWDLNIGPTAQAIADARK
jgi:hypothetical protein